MSASWKINKNVEVERISPAISIRKKMDLSRNQFDKVLDEEHLPCFGEEIDISSCKDRSLNITNPN